MQNTNAVTRDGKILREDLNAFNIKKGGKWACSLKETNNAFVRSIDTLTLADASKTVLPEYFGRTNERTCLMVKNGNEEWYRVINEPNMRPIPVYQHNADRDLDLLAQGRRVGFITVFHPLNGSAPDIRHIDVTRNGKPVHPMASGAHFCSVC